MADLSKGTLPITIIASLLFGGVGIVYAGATKAATIDAKVEANVVATKLIEASSAKTDAGLELTQAEVQRHRERLQSLEDSRTADAKWREKVDDNFERVLKELRKR